DVDRGVANRKAERVQHPLLPRHRLGAGDAEPPREASLGDDTEGHRLAVGQARVARRGLEGVADRVAVVEDVAQLGLALVALDDRGLQAARSGDDRLEHPELTHAQRCEVALELGEVSRVQYDPVLDDLGEPGAELALGPRARYRGGDEPAPGRV